jgi:hypothetical protein
MNALVRGIIGVVMMAASALAGDPLAGNSNLSVDEEVVGQVCDCGNGQVMVEWDVGGGFTGTWNPSNGRYEDGQGNYIEFTYPSDPLVRHRRVQHEQRQQPRRRRFSPGVARPANVLSPQARGARAWGAADYIDTRNFHDPFLETQV